MKRLPTQQGHLFNRHHSIYDGPRKRVLIHLCQKNKWSNGGDKVNGKCQTCLPCWGRQPGPAFIINTTGSHYGNPSLSCCKFNCAKIRSKTERKRKKKKKQSGSIRCIPEQMSVDSEFSGQDFSPLWLLRTSPDNNENAIDWRALVCGAAEIRRLWAC